MTTIASVDEQHQQLVSLINDFGEVVLTAEEAIDPQQFASVSGALLDYARFHFGNEEAQMQRVGLDARYVERHCAEHRSFLFETMHLRDLDHPGPERARDLLEYLVHWLAYHILGVDQSMARQVRAIQGGLSAAAAFESDANYIRSNTEPLLAALGGLFQLVTKRNSELRALNSELEQRVQQRTRELEHANRQLQQQSTHDELTGLPNRRFALLTLQQLWDEHQRYGDPLALLMLDADHFKGVNDRFGHAEGDALLRHLAVRLREAVRASDIVFRLGGDEFLVICPHTGLSGAVEVGKKILAERRPFCTAAGVECWDGAVSIGVAEAGAATDRPDDLLLAADQALYAAKRQGGAKVVADAPS